MIEQVLREWPPGYGGVERVTHELASVLGGVVYSLDVQGHSSVLDDPLLVTYPRKRLPSPVSFGRLKLPLPSSQLLSLLLSPRPLHGHLPSPGVLLILLLARLVRPRRCVTAHWHCFLEPHRGINGWLYGVYQWLALLLMPLLRCPTTSLLLNLRNEVFGTAKGARFNRFKASSWTRHQRDCAIRLYDCT